ncbi:ATP-dependent helicase [Clostridium thermarum]|uniref:ATP-dependent helicase n=1 Tax=Clostridium thermarum TaxID=1716543 RepID=UPI0013D350FF|nr:ATP-dependent helicase [Clostridium thermarum]
MLDIYQSEIVNSKDKNMLVVASPGSGKTTVIINRAGYLIKVRGINPKSIVIITFTKAAALNMKRRFKALFPGVVDPFFGTFHSFFYSILKNQRTSINIISSAESYFVIERTVKRYMGEITEDRIKDILNFISSYKTGYKTLDQLADYININVLKQCISEYETYKKNKDLLDFDDLQIGVAELFKSNSKVLRVYNKRFTHILVDEFQDCDNMQIDILKKLCKGNSIFAVGDEDQCIYGFRGARPDYMVNFSENFEGGTKWFLTNNYRSVKNIVAISGNLIKNNKIRNVKKFYAVKSQDGQITCERYFDDRKQGDGIAAKIISYAQKGLGKYSDNAVLYRTNMEARALIDSFIRNKIPFTLLDKSYNFFNHFICKDMISYINLSLDTTRREDFKRIINKPFRYISKVNLDKLSNYKFKEDCFEVICKIPSLPYFQYKELMNLRRDVLKISQLEIGSVIDFIYLKLNYKKYLEEYCIKYNISKKDMEEILEEFNQSISSFNSLSDFISHVKIVEEEIKKDSAGDVDTVLLSTIHGVKGMEFKNVHIINCVQGIIPYYRGDRPNDMEEERRLFYVGITRAKENLFLSLPLYIKGKSKEESNFISECGIINRIDYTNQYPLGSKVQHKSFGTGIVVEITADKIAIKFKDNITRDFEVHKVISHNLLIKMA